MIWYIPVFLLPCAFALSACGDPNHPGTPSETSKPTGIEARAPEGGDLEEALVEAVLLGDHAMLNDLLSKGVPADARLGGTPALVAAAQADRVPAARMLLEAGASPGAADRRGRTALIVASERGHLPMLETLIDRNSPLDASDSQGWTALMNAVARNHDDCVDALLKAGARRDLTNARGQSAADLARLNGRTDLERRLRTGN